jgi:hypothetical protein
VKKDAVISIAARSSGPTHAGGVRKADASMTVRILPAPSALIRRVQTGVALSAEKWQGIKVKLLARVKHAYTLTVGDARASVVTRSNAEQCDARGLVLVTKGRRNTREHTARALKVLGKETDTLRSHNASRNFFR